MKKTTTILATAAVLAAGLFAFTATDTKWTVNAQDAKIEFTMPNGKHGGTVSGLDASFDFDPMHPELALLKATVDVKQLKADNEKLTAHLMTNDFFDAEHHPTMTFTSEKVVANDSGFVVTGPLAIRDSVHTVSVPFTFKQDGNKATFKGSLDIFAGDYGVGQKSKAGNDRVLVSIEVPVWKE